MGTAGSRATGRAAPLLCKARKTATTKHRQTMPLQAWIEEGKKGRRGLRKEKKGQPLTYGTYRLRAGRTAAAPAPRLQPKVEGGGGSSLRRGVAGQGEAAGINPCPPCKRGACTRQWAKQPAPHLTALEAPWWLAAGCSLQSSVGGAAERLLELQASFTRSLHTYTQFACTRGQSGRQAAHPPARRLLHSASSYPPRMLPTPGAAAVAPRFQLPTHLACCPPPSHLLLCRLPATHLACCFCAGSRLSCATAGRQPAETPCPRLEGVQQGGRTAQPHNMRTAHGHGSCSEQGHHITTQLQ